MAKAAAKKKAEKKASGLRPQASGQSKKAKSAKPTAKAAKPAKEPEPVAAPIVVEIAPRAERGAELACAQCGLEIDAGALRIVTDAGGALHPGCTFGWTLAHLGGATADWMATMMQRSQLSAEDRAELLAELGAPSA